MAINKIKTIAVEDDAIIDTKIAANQVGISELKVSDGSTGEVLSTNGSGTLSFISVSTDNDYVDSLAFTTSSGLLTLGRTSPLSDLSQNLDGRYALLGQVLTDVPAGALFTDTIYTHPSGDGNLHVPATGTSNSGKVLTAGSTAGSLSWSADTDNYVDALNFDTTNGILTVGRTGSLANLTIDLDGRYSLTDNNSYVNSATFTSSTGDLVLGFGGSGNLGNITTNLDGRYHPIDSTSTPSATFKENIQDIVGSMVTSNTETGIAVSYDDAGTTGTGKLNFDVTNIPAGTVMVFYQSAAPTGWTQVATQNNKALRVVSGAGGGSGGTHGLSSPPSTSHSHSHNLSGAATTLSISQMPSHTHTVWGGSVNNAAGGDNVGVRLHNGTGAPPSGATGGGGSHYHNMSGNISSDTPTAFAPQYIDVIICSKNS